MNTPSLRVLFVDDEKPVLSALRRVFRGQTETVLLAGDGSEALALLEANPEIGVVVSDYRMPGMTGVDLLEQVRKRWPSIQRVLLTGYADQSAIEEAINRAQVNYFVSKPWSDMQIRSVVSSANEHHLLLAANEDLYQQLRDQNQRLEQKVEERTRALTVAAESWRRTVDAMVDPVLVVRPDRVVMRSNSALARRSGLTVHEVPGRFCFELLFGRESPCENCQIEEVLDTGERGVWKIEGEETYRVYAHRLSDDPSGPEGVVLAYHDIDEEERLNRRLMQTVKLVGLGRLAGGVAHEINNPLAGILTFTQMMQLDPGRSAEDLEQLGHVETAARRCMRIVEGLLHFSRTPVESSKASFAPEEVLANLDAIVEPLAVDCDLDLRVHRDEVLREMQGSVSEIEQVVVILITNAVHAIGSSGRIELRLEPGPLGIRITVEDSGSGVPLELKSKIFDPFFTTKPEGQGTGLGLSIAHRIIESHGGQITVESSDLLGGARMIIDLPSASSED